MSENYYMHDYIEPDQDRIDEIRELEEKIEDLELEVSRLQDELDYAIPIEYLEKYLGKKLADNLVKEWKEEGK